MKICGLWGCHVRIGSRMRDASLNKRPLPILGRSAGKFATSAASQDSRQTVAVARRNEPWPCGFCSTGPWPEKLPGCSLAVALAVEVPPHGDVIGDVFHDKGRA